MHTPLGTCPGSRGQPLCSNRFPGVAQWLNKQAPRALPQQGVRYSPTFHIFRGSKLVDRVLGKEAQRLDDHLWLHSD
jgi:hypothetical protein